VKVQGKLNNIILESVLMLLTKKNYQTWFMLVETAACRSWHVFLRHSSVVFSSLLLMLTVRNQSDSHYYFCFLLPRDVMQVRPMSSCSVCVSVTLVDHVKTNKHIMKIF